jgi:hypothetical protein
MVETARMYNDHKGGVDRADGFTNQYLLSTPSKKDTKNLHTWFRLFRRVIVAYVYGILSSSSVRSTKQRTLEELSSFNSNCWLESNFQE